jgi:hypothetical protein
MLVYSEFRKSKFYPFKSDLRILWTGASGGTSGSGTSGTSGTLVFWFSGTL